MVFSFSVYKAMLSTSTILSLSLNWWVVSFIYVVLMPSEEANFLSQQVSQSLNFSGADTWLNIWRSWKFGLGTLFNNVSRIQSTNILIMSLWRNCYILCFFLLMLSKLYTHFFNFLSHCKKGIICPYHKIGGLSILVSTSSVDCPNIKANNHSRTPCMQFKF